MMIVFRLEHFELGCGPFRIQEVNDCEEYFGEDYDDFDDLIYDLCNSMTGNHVVPNIMEINNKVCGCESLEDIAFWFNDYIDDLMEFGFIINVYETEDYMLHKNQTLFNKESSKLIGTIHNISSMA